MAMQSNMKDQMIYTQKTMWKTKLRGFSQMNQNIWERLETETFKTK